MSGHPRLSAAEIKTLQQGARAAGVCRQDLADLAFLLNAASADIRASGYEPRAALAAARHAAETGQPTLACVYCLLAHIRAQACGRRDLSADALEMVAAVERRTGCTDLATQLETAAARQRTAITR